MTLSRLCNVSVTQQVKRRQKSNFHLHLSNPLPSIHWFSPCLCCSPLQSSCQPATSSGAATGASWQEMAPSVSVPTALRSGRMERAAEVGFSCTGGAVCLIRCTAPSPFGLGQTSLTGISRICTLRTICLQAEPAYNELHPQKIDFLLYAKPPDDLTCRKCLICIFNQSCQSQRGQNLKKDNRHLKLGVNQGED